MAAVFGAAAHVGTGDHLLLDGFGQLLRRSCRFFIQHSLERAGTHRKPVAAILQPGSGTGEHRNVGLAVAHRLVAVIGRFFPDQQTHHDVPVVGTLGILPQRHDAALIQLHRAVHGQEQGQHIRKAKPAVDAAADGGQVAQLHAHDVAQRFPDGSVGKGFQSGVGLQLAQGDHRPNGKARIRFLDRVQPQAGQVDGCADIDGLHLEPDHAAQDAVGLFLVELPGFFQTFGPFVFSDRHHMQVPFFFILAVSILTQTQIAFQSAIAL